MNEIEFTFRAIGVLRTPYKSKLDIKPFVPKFDHRENARVGWMEGTFRDMKGVPLSDNRF